MTVPFRILALPFLILSVPNFKMALSFRGVEGTVPKTLNSGVKTRVTPKFFGKAKNLLGLLYRYGRI